MNYMQRWAKERLKESFEKNILEVFDSVYDRAYESGYRDGSNDNNSDYNKGLENAWECLKRIIGMGEPEEICGAAGLRNFVTSVHESTYEFDNTITTCFDGIKKDGTCLRSCPMKYYTYTGRHFDHVNQMLKLFGGNTDEVDT